MKKAQMFMAFGLGVLAHLLLAPRGYKDAWDINFNKHLLVEEVPTSATVVMMQGDKVDCHVMYRAEKFFGSCWFRVERIEGKLVIERMDGWASGGGGRAVECQLFTIDDGFVVQFKAHPGPVEVEYSEEDWR